LVQTFAHERRLLAHGYKSILEQPLLILGLRGGRHYASRCLMVLKKNSIAILNYLGKLVDGHWLECWNGVIVVVVDFQGWAVLGDDDDSNGTPEVDLQLGSWGSCCPIRQGGGQIT
jgi:hypothetical protein